MKRRNAAKPKCQNTWHDDVNRKCPNARLLGSPYCEEHRMQPRILALNPTEVAQLLRRMEHPDCPAISKVELGVYEKLLKAAGRDKDGC